MEGNGTLAGQPPRLRLTGAEWVLLLVLAAVQFTHIMDFIIIMPLEPQFEATLGINANQFGVMVSVYGFSAALAGLAAALWLDRFDRKRSLLVLYAGFTAGTLLCAVAPSYPWLLVARTVAGAFGGVAGANLLAIIGDVFPDVRRGTAMGVIMSAFSVASVAGVPAGLLLAGWSSYGWRATFAAIGLLAVGVLPLTAAVLPPQRGHLTGQPQRPNLWAVLTHPSHLRAYALMTALVMSSFTVVPFLAAYLFKNVGRTQDELPYIYLLGGAATLLIMTPIGRLSDRLGKLPVFRVLALTTLVPFLLVTNLPPGTSLALTLVATTLLFITTAGRMVPAMAMITGSAAPRYRGSFMSVNSCVQQMAAGVAPLVAGMILSDAGNGQPMTGFPAVGLLSCTAVVCSVVLAGRLRLADEDRATVPAGMNPGRHPRSGSSPDVRLPVSSTNPPSSADGPIELSRPKA
jgi:predicted MFS family arabinose efflux permease